MRSFYDSEADDGRLVDSELISHAVAFAAAADAYKLTYPQQDWKVLSFLMARSIELGLKAYALHKRADRQKLKRLGHDLVAVLDFARNNGLKLESALSDQEENSVGVLNVWYKDKYLEYPLIRPYAFPQFKIVRKILDNILASVYIAIHGQSEYERDRELPKFGGLKIVADYEN